MSTAPPDTTESSAPALPRAFISYSRRDVAVARIVFDGLESRGIDAWIDWEGIPPSAEWWREVEEAIESSEAFVFIVSPESLASRVCRDEVLHALRHNKRLVALIARDAAVHESASTSDVAAALARIHWIFMRDPGEFGPGMTQLAQAIVTDLDWVRDHSRLLVRALEWQARGRNRSYLLRDDDLVAAEAWIAQGATKSPGPTALQVEYVVASRGDARQRRRRLLAGSGIAAALIAVAGLVAGWQALVSNARESEATSRRLAAQAPLAFENDAPDLGLLLAAHAWDRARTMEAAQSLFAGIERMRGVRAMLPGRYDESGPMALSADGRLLAAGACVPATDPGACDRYQLTLLDTTEGRVVARFGAAFDGAHEAAFDPLGRRLAVSLTEPSNRVMLVELPADLANVPQPVVLGAGAGELTVPGEAISQLAFVAQDELDGIGRDIVTWRLADGGVAGRRTLTLAALRDRSGRRFALDNTEATELATSLLFDKGGLLPAGTLPESAVRAPPAQIVFDRTRSLAAVIGCAMMASGRHCQGELRLLDLGTRHVRGSMQSDLPRFDTMLAAAFLPQGRMLVTGGCAEHSRTEACLHGALRLWRVSPDGLEPAGPPLRAPGGEVRRLVVAANGGTMVSASGTGHVVAWSVDDAIVDAGGTLPSVLQTRPPAEARGPAIAVTCHREEVTHPDLRVVAAKLKDPRTLCAALPERAAVTAYDADRRLLAVGACNESGAGPCASATVRLWQVADGLLVKVRDHALTGAPSALAFGPAARAELAIAHCASTAYHACTDAAHIELAALSADGVTRIASGLGRVSSLAWDAQGRRLAVATCAVFPASGPPTDGCGAGVMQLLEVGVSGPARPVDGTLGGHRNLVSAMAFDATGGVLASGDLDGRVALWSTATRQAFGAPLPMHYEGVVAIGFTSEGAARVTAGDLVIDWNTDVQQWQRRACRLAARPLTSQEHQRWIGTAGARASDDPCSLDTVVRRTHWLARLHRLMVGEPL